MKFNKLAVNFVLAIVLSFVLLFVVGTLGAVKAYNSFSLTKLVFIQLVLFISLTIALNQSLKHFLVYKQNRRIVPLILLIGSFLAAEEVITFSTAKYGVGLSYIIAGDYLRDAHDINIYFMDWGGWAITAILYLTIMFFFLLNEISKNFLEKHLKLK